MRCAPVQRVGRHDACMPVQRRGKYRAGAKDMSNAGWAYLSPKGNDKVSMGNVSAVARESVVVRCT